MAGWLPSAEHEQLLRACLLEGDAALDAWRQWKPVFESGPVDASSRRMLPLLYRNLQTLDVRDAPLDALKSEYFHTWSQTQFSFRCTSALIEAFNQVGIKTIVLKGAALATSFYQDPGLRPMRDVDLLVRRQDARHAIRFLSKLGWTSRYSPAEPLIPFEHAAEFTDERHQGLDLHWQVMWEARQGVADDDFWAGAMPITINQAPTLALNSADQVLHVCVHGAKWNDLPSWRWVPDALMVIRSTTCPVDWGRVVQQAQKRRLTLPMIDTLQYLETSFGARVPSAVFSQLRRAPSTRFERMAYRIRLGSDDTLKPLVVLAHWANSLRVDCEGPLPNRVLQWLRYLKSLWGVPRLWHLPFHIVAKAAARLARVVSRRVGVFRYP